MATHKPILPVKRVFNPMRLLVIAVLIAILFSGLIAFSVLAAAPAEGTVVEGVSVLGLAPGDTRAQVEAAYGGPGGCQDTEVGGMDVIGEKIKSERHVIVVISVRGEQGQPVSGATVVGTWTYPRGAVQTVKEITSNTGYAFFELADARNGTWTLTIDDVLLDAHPLDREGSVLNVTFEANRLK